MPVCTHVHTHTYVHTQMDYPMNNHITLKATHRNSSLLYLCVDSWYVGWEHLWSILALASKDSIVTMKTTHFLLYQEQN